MLLEQLADTHAPLLAAHGMPQLDLTQITSKTRPVTQAISRDLFDQDAAGVLFHSNHDATVIERAPLPPGHIRFSTTRNRVGRTR